MLSSKTALLLTLGLAKHAGEIHAHVVLEACICFSGDTSCITTNLAFEPKVPHLHTLCPVQALWIYLDSTQTWDSMISWFCFLQSSWLYPVCQAKATTGLWGLLLSPTLVQQVFNFWIICVYIPPVLGPCPGIFSKEILFRGVSGYMLGHLFCRLDITAQTLTHLSQDVAPPLWCTFWRHLSSFQACLAIWESFNSEKSSYSHSMK